MHKLTIAPKYVITRLSLILCYRNFLRSPGSLITSVPTDVKCYVNYVNKFTFTMNFRPYGRSRVQKIRDQKAYHKYNKSTTCGCLTFVWYYPFMVYLYHIKHLQIRNEYLHTIMTAHNCSFSSIETRFTEWK